MNVLGLACVIAFGKVAVARKEARALMAAMVILVSLGAGAIYAAETLTPQPAMQAAGIAAGPSL